MAKELWWIYDEHDRERPGWRQWRLQGLFKDPPAEGIGARSSHALCQACDGDAWRAFMLRPATHSLHEIRSRSKWGPVHKALLAAPEAGLRAEWIAGVDSLCMEIDEMAFMPQRAASERALAEALGRAAASPRLWPKGTEPDAAYAGALALWAASMDAWAHRPGCDALRAHALSESDCAPFLRELASGNPSPATAWATSSRAVAGFGPGEVEWLAWRSELGCRMEALEIEAGAAGGHVTLKAKRI